MFISLNPLKNLFKGFFKVAYRFKGLIKVINLFIFEVIYQNCRVKGIILTWAFRLYADFNNKIPYLKNPLLF